MKKPSLDGVLATPSLNKFDLPSNRITAPVKEQAVGTAPSRIGKKAIIAYFSPECVLQLKQIGLERGGRSQQEMLAEALNDFFKKYEKATLA